MMSNKIKIMGRIRKLFALAGNNPSESEAMAAMDKARKLMVEHNFNEAEVRQVESQYVVKGYKSSSSRAKTRKKKFFKSKSLAAHVAHLNDCKAFTKHDKGEACFFGEAHDVEVSIFMMELLQNAFTSAWRHYLRSFNRDFAKGSLASQKTSFENGMVMRLANRLAIMIQDKEAQVAGYSGGMALMVAKDKAVSAAFDKDHPMPTARQKNVTINDKVAARAGYEAGGRVNICTGIDEDKAGRLA